MFQLPDLYVSTSATVIPTITQHVTPGSLLVDTSSAPLIGNHATPFTPSIPQTSPTSFLSQLIPSTTRPDTIVSTEISSTTADPQAVSTPGIPGASDKSNISTGAIAGGTIGGVALIIAVVFMIRLKRKRRPNRIKKTDIQLISPFHDPQVQNSARELFQTGPQYTNLPIPPQPPAQVTPFPPHCMALELGKNTSKSTDTAQRLNTPQRPIYRPDVIPENVLEEMRASPAPYGVMEFTRHTPGPTSLPPGSYLGRSELGTPTGFRDDGRDTRESYGLSIYQQNIFNQTRADEHPEPNSHIQDGTRNVFLRTAMQRNLPINKLARESLRDSQPNSKLSSSSLHYRDRESRLSPPPLRINKNEGYHSDVQRGPSKKGHAGKQRYFDNPQTENVQDKPRSSEGIRIDHFYDTGTSGLDSGTTYLGTPITFTGSPKDTTSDTLRESQIPLSQEELEFDRINTQRRLGGFAPLPTGTPSSEWRTSEAPVSSQRNLPPPRKIPRFNTASSVYPESEYSMPHHENSYLGDHVEWSRLDGMFMKDGNLEDI